jgi:hypothetical protein
MKYFSELGKNVRFLVFEQSNLLMLRHRQDGRCPVALYKLYKSLRPADMCKDNGVLIYHGYLAHLYSLIFHLIVRGSTNLCRPTQGLHLLALLYIVHV